MYQVDIWRFDTSTEREYKFIGKYGRKGEKRQKRKKPTPEQVKLQNHRNKENRIRRIMKANFHENDYWVTLKYPEGTRLKIKEVKKHMRGFLKHMRKKYKKEGQVLKFIYRIEIGKRGGLHVHILVNRFKGADLVIRESWEHGDLYFKFAYEEGGFKKLADYIVKPPAKERDSKKETLAYSRSRNLVVPQPEREKYTRRTLEKMIRNGIEPTKGYYIDVDSVYYGTNPFTGMSYLKYIEYKLPEKKAGGTGRKKGSRLQEERGEETDAGTERITPEFTCSLE